MASTIPRDALGLGLRLPHYAYLFERWPELGYFEVISENFLSDAEAARWMRKAADQGNSEAWHALGVLYEGGRGVPKDAGEAAKWYRRAGERGNPVSQNNLGAMDASGVGVPKDDGEAVAWYRKAADQGNARGQYNLAMMYVTGQGVPRDEAEAARLLRRAADQGLAAAQFQNQARGKSVIAHGGKRLV